MLCMFIASYTPALLRRIDKLLLSKSSELIVEEKKTKKNNRASHHFLSSKALPRLLLRESEPICWAVRCRIYESRDVQPIRFHVIRLIAVISFIWMTGECKWGWGWGRPAKIKNPPSPGAPAPRWWIEMLLKESVRQNKNKKQKQNNNT